MKKILIWFSKEDGGYALQEIDKPDTVTLLELLQEFEKRDYCKTLICAYTITQEHEVFGKDSIVSVDTTDF